MDQTQIEAVINDRIEELRRLEAGASRASKVSYQDKRDELEALLFRLRGLAVAMRLAPS